jgi:hypothetical protein
MEPTPTRPEEGVTSAPAITPLWRRVPALLAYPLQPACAVWILAGALATAIVRGGVLPSFAPEGAGAVGIGLGSWVGGGLIVARFASLVVERSAGGFLEPRMWPRTLAGGSWARALRLLAVGLLLPLALSWVLARLLPQPLPLLALALLVPAALAGVVQTDGIAVAFDPRRGAAMARAMGSWYLVLCLAPAIALAIDRAWMLACLPDYTPPAPGATAPSAAALGANAFVWGLGTGYLLLLAAASVGYAMYEYNAALGVAVTGPGEVRLGRSDTQAHYARRQREASVARLVAAGEIGEAISAVNDELRQRPRDIVLHAQLRTLLLHEGAQVRIAAHAERFLQILLESGNGARAVALLHEVRASQPAFDIREAGQRVALARAAIDGDDTALATELVHGFDKRFPGDPLVPEAFLLGGRQLLLWGREAQAREMFAHVARIAPPGPVAQEARRYLARFDSPGTNPAGIAPKA